MLNSAAAIAAATAAYCRRLRCICEHLKCAICVSLTNFIFCSSARSLAHTQFGSLELKTARRRDATAKWPACFQDAWRERESVRLTKFRSIATCFVRARLKWRAKLLATKIACLSFSNTKKFSQCKKRRLVMSLSIIYYRHTHIRQEDACCTKRALDCGRIFVHVRFELLTTQSFVFVQNNVRSSVRQQKRLQ